eukprot:scaffold1266_cov92-Isochrysis_galbana.AAC.5
MWTYIVPASPLLLTTSNRETTRAARDTGTGTLEVGRQQGRVQLQTARPSCIQREQHTRRHSHSHTTTMAMPQRARGRKRIVQALCKPAPAGLSKAGRVAPSLIVGLAALTPRGRAAALAWPTIRTRGRGRMHGARHRTPSRGAARCIRLRAGL